MNKKTALLFALGLMLGAAGLLLVFDHNGSKPALNALTAEVVPLDVGITLPLQIRLTPLAEAAPGKVVPMQVECTLQMPQAEVALKLEWPRTAQLAGGAAEWRGLMRQGEPLKLDFALRWSGAEPGYVFAKAEVFKPDGNTFTQGSSIYLDPQRRAESAQAMRPVQGYAGAGQIRVHRSQAEKKQ